MPCMDFEFNGTYSDRWAAPWGACIMMRVSAIYCDIESILDMPSITTSLDASHNTWLSILTRLDIFMSLCGMMSLIFRNMVSGASGHKARFDM